jgi:hypothetical protein
MMNDKDLYIQEKMNMFAQDIDDYNIDDIVYDKDDSECLITNKTANSIEVLIYKKGKDGVDATNWFTMQSFDRRFRK